MRSRRGNIGIVGASGTGTQEVTVLVDRLGGGVSQVLGTGGRDLKEEIGGIMMLDCIAALAKDRATEVIVLISKPPAAEVAEKILRAIKCADKPAVVCFLNSRAAKEDCCRISFCSTLEETAQKAVELSGPKVPASRQNRLFRMVCAADLLQATDGLRPVLRWYALQRSRRHR